MLFGGAVGVEVGGVGGGGGGVGGGEREQLFYKEPQEPRAGRAIYCSDSSG